MGAEPIVGIGIQRGTGWQSNFWYRRSVCKSEDDSRHNLNIQLLKGSVLTTAAPVKGLSVSQDPKLVSGRNETRSCCVVELSVPGIKERIDREFARLRNRNPLFGSPVKRVFSPFHSGRIRFRPKVEATCVSH